MGGSDAPAGQVCHHEDPLAVLDALGVEDAVLVGCSMGGAYPLDAALAEPGRVRALALISSGLSGHVWPADMQDQVGRAVREAVPQERLAHYLAGAASEVPADDVEAIAQVQARFLVAGPNRLPQDVHPAVWSWPWTCCGGSSPASGPLRR